MVEVLEEVSVEPQALDQVESVPIHTKTLISQTIKKTVKVLKVVLAPLAVESEEAEVWVLEVLISSYPPFQTRWPWEE